MIERDRVWDLRTNSANKGKYVLYWMHASQRVKFNHALEYAIEKANEKDQPLLTFFSIYGKYPNASYRHFRFMLEGMAEVERELEKRGIRIIVKIGNPIKTISEYASDASMVVTDIGYTRINKEWMDELLEVAEVPISTVESNIVVPVETTSTKEEYSAATIRRKINSKSAGYLVPTDEHVLKNKSLDQQNESVDLTRTDNIIKRMGIKKDARYKEAYHGGRTEALGHLKDFLEQKISKYHLERNDPSKDCQSNISPYLHFGNISPIEVSLLGLNMYGPGAEGYLEELIVRRELAINFVHHNIEYDKYTSIPEWAKKTLEEHSFDEREHIYRYKDLEDANTHDPYWNAAQKEMLITGKMHGYMRMYWGKKIIEWTENPITAHKIMLKLNDTYELDGRDPNGYTGVAWCFGKHDRAWKERKIFGKVRYMNANGLKRKFDIGGYVQKINEK